MGKTYIEKLEAFRSLLEKHTAERQKRLFNTNGSKIGVENGYKFDKVFEIDKAGVKQGRYMVESRTGTIFGIKSWTQVNKRRQYGTLDTIDQYDWSELHGRPLPGTQAEKDNVNRETAIKASQKRRGRKPKAFKLSTKPSGN